jgi:hypothetical protein
MINDFYKFADSYFLNDEYHEDGSFKQQTKYIYKDYTDIKYYKISLWDEIKSNEWITYYTLSDNEKIENVSYNLYGTPDYWDLILGINYKNPLFDMIYDYDNLESSVDIYLEKYEQMYFGEMSDEHKEKLKQIFISDKLKNNEKNRTIKVIKPNRIQDFFRLMKDRKFYPEEV